MSSFPARMRLIVVSIFVLCAVIAAAGKFGLVGKADTELAAPTVISGGSVTAPAFPVALVSATMTSTLAFDTDNDGRLDPTPSGDQVLYTVTINGGGPAQTGVVFTDTLPSNLTLVAGSVTASPLAADDTYTATGNVQISVLAASGLLANDVNPLAVGNGGLAVSSIGTDVTSPFSFTTALGSTITSSATDGSFSFNPPVGYVGNDSFQYTITGPGGATATATATVTISNMVWFVNSASTCSSSCDGRLTNPFTSLSAFNTANDAATGHPKDNDNIFLYTGSYTGPVTLRNGQRFLGQGATNALFGSTSLTGITLAPNSDPTPTTQGSVTPVTITSSNANGINLKSGNTIRGLTVGNTGTGTKIIGNSFGTLTVGNSTTPDVTLNGTGKALDLTTGAFAATSGFSSVATTSSGTQGIFLSAVSGTVSLGSTAVLNSTIQGIYVLGSTADINFGNTAVTGGKTGVQLENNSAGTRTFGTLTLSGNSGAAFLHQDPDFFAVGGDGPFVGGGTTTVTGATSISGQTAPSLGIFILNSTTPVTFAGTTVNKASAPASVGDGVRLTANSGNTTFSTLNISNQSNGLSIDSVSGQVNVTNAAGSSITTTGGAAISAFNAPTTTPLNLNFTSLSSTTSSSTQRGILLNRVSGTINSVTTMVTNPANGEGISIRNSGPGTLNFGNTTVNDDAGTESAIRLGIDTDSTTGNSANITFGTLNIDSAPNTRAFWSAFQTGTVTSTSGTISDTGTATAVQIDGTSAASKTPLNMQLTSVSSNGAANGINLTSMTGSFAVVGNGGTCTIATPTCDGGSIQSSTGKGISLNNVGSVSLTRMKIQNSGTFGIGTPPVNIVPDVCAGACVNGFTLDNSIVTDAAGVATDDGVVLTNVAGAVSITNSVISNAPHNGITIDNFNTNMAGFNFTNSTISCDAGQPCQPSGSLGNDGLLLTMRGNSVLPNGLVSGSTFSGVRAVGVQVQTNDTGRIGVNNGPLSTFVLTTANSFVVQSNTFTGNGQGIDMGQSQVSNMTFQVLTNTVVGKVTVPNAIANTASSHAINAFTAAGADTGPAIHSMVGKIDGNIIGTQGVKDSGSGFGSGIRVVVQGQTTQGDITVNNNTIREVPNSNILNFFGQNGAAAAGTLTARFKITNNTLPAPSGSNLSLCGPVNTPCAEDGLFVLADQGTPVCTVITGNNIFDVLSVNGGVADIYLAERVGPPAGAQLTVEGTGGSNSGYILANNTLAGVNKFVDEGANTSQVGIGACGTFPSIPNPADEGAQNILQGFDNRLSLLGVSYASMAESLAGVRPMIQKCSIAKAVAARQVINSGSIDELPVEANADVSRNEAGAVGTWNIEDNQARTHGPSAETNDAGIWAAVNEITGKIANAIAPTVSAQERTIGANPNGPLSGETVTINGGGSGFTIPVGKSVTITFKATLTNPPNVTLQSPPRVSNQGTVTYSTGGGGSVLTDDPSIGGATDPTTTTVDLFNSITGLTTNFTATNSSQVITFTATPVIDPANVPQPAVSTATTGTVTFKDNGTSIAACTNLNLSSGSVQCQTTLPSAGSPHSITAVYSGDGNYDPSTSSSQTVTIVNPPTVIKSFAFTKTILTVSESGSTVTVNPNSAESFPVGAQVTIAGVGVAGYNGKFIITGATASTFTYTNPVTGLSSSGGGTAAVGGASIPLGTTTVMSFAVNNPNATAGLTGIGFLDTLPAGITAPDSTTSQCGGTVTVLSNVVTFSGGTLSGGGGCVIVVTVTGAQAGSWDNTATGVTSFETGPGANSNTANLKVFAPPTISKSFTPSTIVPGGNSVLKVTITNPATNPGSLTGVGFTDTFPNAPNLVVANPPTPVLTNCGPGTLTNDTNGVLTANDPGVKLSGATVVVGTPCTVSINVKPLAAGPFNNVSGNVTSTNGGPGNTASATLLTNTPPSITAAAPLSRQQGSAAVNSQIATVSDPDQAANTLGVTATPLTGTGVTVTGILIDAGGNVTANVQASCTATNSTFTLTVTDNAAAQTTATLTVNVTTNTAPVQGNYSSVGPINPGTGTTVSPSAAPTDNGSISTITAAAPGFTGTFLVNTSTGVVTVTNAGPSGTFTVTVTATDNCGLASTKTFGLMVNTPPTVTPSGAISRQQGSPAGAAVQVATVSDVDQTANSLTVTQIAGGTATGITVSNLTNTNGAVTAVVGASCTAIAGTVRFQATDAGGLLGNGDLTVNVPANTAPVLTYTTPAAIVVGSPVTISPATGPSDNGSVSSIAVQNTGTYTGTISVDNTTGVVSISNAKPVGTHTITIRSTDNCGTTTDSTFQLTVGKASTTTTLLSTGSPTVFGQQVTFTATVGVTSPGAGTPTGTVSFFDNGVQIGTGTISGGQATFSTTSLAVGSHPISAAYSGDGNFNLSTSSTVTQVVGKAGTSTVLTIPGAATTNVSVPYAVNWSVTVNNPGAGTPTGTVTVSDGTGIGSASCTANVSAGACNLTPVTGGVKSVTATYNGDGNFTVSTSAPVSHSVQITISGNIKQQPGNTNLQNVSVSLTGTNAPGAVLTDGNGNYSFTGLFTGASYTVTPTLNGFAFNPQSRTFVSPNTDIPNADFTAFVGSVPRFLSIPTTYATPGQTADVLVNVLSLGNERTFTFTLTYDQTLLNSPVASCGTSDALCTVSQSAAGAGAVAVTVTPATQIGAGDRNIVRVTFQTIANEPANTTIAFSPNNRSVVDASNNPLSATYLTPSLMIFAIGVEGDVWNTAQGIPGNGDGKVDALDVIQEARLIANRSFINPNTNEFQRVDTATGPPTKGDGVINVADLVQTLNYLAGNNGGNRVAAGGPMQPLPTPPPLTRPERAERTMRVVSTTADKGGNALVSIELDPKGDEVATSFSLKFDPTKLKLDTTSGTNNPDITTGSGAPNGTSLMVNADEAETGNLGIVVFNGGLTPFTKDGAAKQVVTIRFHVAREATEGETAIEFDGSDSAPTPSSTADANAHDLTSSYENGTVTITGQTSTTAEVSGRVLTPDGHGLRNAKVTITDENGTTRTATTSSFGFYQFDSLVIGRIYTLSVSSKTYRFASKSIQVNDNLLDVDLIGHE